MEKLPSTCAMNIRLSKIEQIIVGTRYGLFPLTRLDVWQLGWLIYKRASVSTGVLGRRMSASGCGSPRRQLRRVLSVYRRDPATYTFRSTASVCAFYF
jgi:hypothetical protein